MAESRTTSEAHPLLGRHLSFVHAVNGQKRLRAFLSSSSDVAEADISLGLCPRGRRRKFYGLIMAHPPKPWSDLTLEAFIGATCGSDRIAKLDFKSPRTLGKSLSIVRRCARPEQTMVNIDCVRGPGGGRPSFRAADLAVIRRGAPGVLLSIGATTSRGAGPYDEHHIRDFLNAYDACEGAATVAIRADAALAKPERIKPLLRQGIQLTMWNHPWWNPTTPSLLDALRSAWPAAWLDVHELSRTAR